MSGYQLQQHRRRGSDVSLDGPATSGRELDDDEQSIIDVFEFDDTAQDRWLCSLGSSRRNSIEEKVEDLDAWLHADVSEQEATQSDNGLRKSIDTRTFTRMKRRPNRLSFDGLEASGSSNSTPFQLSNVWKHQVIPESPQNNNNNDKDLTVQKERRDSIPMMLRPKTNQVLAAILSEGPSSISSQTSMEAFMNAARSKDEYNSMLSDISDPDISHFLMNISQPSLLYSSIISDGKGDESIQQHQQQQQQQQVPIMSDSMADSQILTDSMMEASMFKEVQDTSMLTEFLRQNDCTILENKTFNKSPNESETNDKTFVNDNLHDKTYVNGMDENLKNVNETFLKYSNSKANSTFTSFPSPIPKSEGNITKIISHEQSLNATQIISEAAESLNSTKTLQDCEVPVFKKKDVLSTTLTLGSEQKTDLTYELNSTVSPTVKQKMDATYEAKNFSGGQIPRLSASIENCGNLLDATFNAIPNLRSELLQEVQRSSGNKYDAHFTSAPLPSAEPKLDVTYERSSSAEPLPSENFDATYVQVPSLQQPESQSANQACLDVTYEPTQVNSKLSNIGGARRISYAKKNAVPSQMPLTDQNRFNTYRKDSKISGRFSKAPQAQESQLNRTTTVLQPNASSSKSNDNLYQQRFSTFSKKTTSMLKNSVAAAGDSAVENKISGKPTNKIPRQWPAPRQLSKLPQLFQKSNPNLGSTMKPSGKLLEADATFNKGSQPNVSSNMYALGRFKSEQRLLPSKHNADFPRSGGTSRSMESIESTASAHSAPDLDDRLSSCSDVSRSSYTVQSKNIEVLKKLAAVDELSGKVGGSTPLVKGRPVLENTWVQEKDLPSPILKNGIDRYRESVENIIASPNDDSEFSAKTSSPLVVSPAISDQAINTIGNDDGGIEATKENIQATENVPQQSKQIKVQNTVSAPINSTKLRRPTNWAGTANKVANGAVSGIPRPASRIPAPKFSRPNLK